MEPFFISKLSFFLVSSSYGSIVLSTFLKGEVCFFVLERSSKGTNPAKLLVDPPSLF
jgi:hypothetical protein